MTPDALKNAGKRVMLNIASARDQRCTKDPVFWLAEMTLFFMT